MTAKELRKKYLDFFKERGHAIIPSASLIPEHDPTVLFTTAGMHPLVAYLLGEKHPAGKRLVNFQKCIRTGDIDSVGDQWHLTFFEMLGNWSLDDYWKKEAIGWSFEFLNKVLKIPAKSLAVSVFKGDKDAPFDQESFEVWKGQGIPENQIYKYGKEDNWWGPVGKTGPCGPCSEMFYITDKEPCGSDCQPSCSCGKYVEIWNDVFMEYEKKVTSYAPLKQKNTDTGMGLERTLAVLNNLEDNYQNEHIKPILEKVEELSGKKYGESEEVTRAMRIIVDHTRSAAFILGDELGIEPSNLDQGYILRRLIRRAIRQGKKLGIEGVFTFKIAEVVVKLMADVYPELKKSQEFITNQLVREEEKFSQTLEKGLKEFERMTVDKVVSGQEAFILFSTYGFPFEMTEELAREKGVRISKKEFDQEFKKHQKLSRAGAVQRFKGGLADASEISKKYHTATHLLQAALRQVLGSHVAQKGSNITVERLRFDFSHQEKMTPEQIRKVEALVNDAIKKDLPVKVEEMTVAEAKKAGATGLFEQKYGEKVKVYSIGDPSTGSGQVFSKEICGGPHVEHTGELGHFRIKKEESSSAGIRRIKAVLEFV